MTSAKTTIKQMHSAQQSMYRANFALGEKIDALEAENERLRGANDLLTWLHSQEQLELAWGAVEDLSECSWRVHSVSGAINDREWEVIATGVTPAEALANARTALGETQ